MSGEEVLAVDPNTLDGVAHRLSAAGDALTALDAGAPVGDAGAAVPQLETAAACRYAQGAVAAEVAALSGDVRGFADRLHNASTEYRAGDATAAEAIRQASPAQS